MKKVRRKKDNKPNKKKKLNTDTALPSNVAPTNPGDVLNNKYLTNPDPELVPRYQKNTPFSFVELENFTSEEFAREALKELKTEKWYKKRNDLYTFRQTDDFKNTKKVTLSRFRDSLYSQVFRDFLKQVTSVELNSTVDLAGQHYQQGSNLLCHDDELDGRRIAFIWYLVPEDWSAEDGGHFCLYGNDGGKPTVEPLNRFIPKWNTVLFFETTPTTWHQVSEVLSKKDRYSISGWFHGTPYPRVPQLPETMPEPTPIQNLPSGFKPEDFINPQYFDEEAHRPIIKHFSTHSSIGLPNFLKPDKYKTVLAELEKAEWKTIGPPTRRHYGSLGRPIGERETGAVLELKNFLKSKEFAEFVQQLTGLTVNAAEEGEVRRFAQGDYTLVHDGEYQHQSFGLDVCLTVRDPNSHWEDEAGGHTTYMDSESELLALPSQPNVLCLVYRDVGCMKFVKYLTCQVPSVHYDFTNTFKTEDVEDGDDDGSDSDDDDEQEDDENEEEGDGDGDGDGDGEVEGEGKSKVEAVGKSKAEESKE